LIGITDGYLSLTKDGGDVREDLKLAESDLGKEILQKYDAGEDLVVTVLHAMNEEAAIGFKPLAKQ
ncbi:hypothetical protein scyTo_0022423, partial [Scyliorhinus torazame]|nr:hypothetical protein [Scyliorhinus torazame]